MPGWMIRTEFPIAAKNNFGRARGLDAETLRELFGLDAPEQQDAEVVELRAAS